jgi:RNA polymerase sigma factor (sigma-70 family)
MSNILSTLEMNLFRAGDNGVFNKIYDKFFGSLCDFSCSITKDYEEARDIAASSFGILWVAKESEQFKEEEDLKKFLFIVVRNASLNFIRRRKIRGNLVELDDDLHANEDNLLYRLEETLTIQAISDSIEKMPGKNGEVLKRLICKKQDPREVADQLRMSPNTVAQNKRFGLAKLKKFFGRE